MTYAIDNPDYPDSSKWRKICPEGYTPIPQLDIEPRWPLTVFPMVIGVRDLSQATLASDNMKLMAMKGGGMDPVAKTGGHGMTAHGDFMSGWTTDEIIDLITNCYHIGTPKNCGHFGNGHGS